jgi:hypothetical protein
MQNNGVRPPSEVRSILCVCVCVCVCSQPLEGSVQSGSSVHRVPRRVFVCVVVVVVVMVCAVASIERQLFQEALRAQLCVIVAHGLDQVAALVAAQLELESLTLRVLENVTKLSLRHGRKLLEYLEGALRGERTALVRAILRHIEVAARVPRLWRGVLPRGEAHVLTSVACGHVDAVQLPIRKVEEEDERFAADDRLDKGKVLARQADLRSEGGTV